MGPRLCEEDGGWKLARPKFALANQGTTAITPLRTGTGNRQVLDQDLWMSTPDTIDAAARRRRGQAVSSFSKNRRATYRSRPRGALGRMVGKAGQKVALTGNDTDDELDVIALALRPGFSCTPLAEKTERVAPSGSVTAMPCQAIEFSDATISPATAAYADVANCCPASMPSAEAIQPCRAANGQRLRLDASCPISKAAMNLNAIGRVRPHECRRGDRPRRPGV